MAQSWLAERRGEDYAPQRKTPTDQHQERLRQLVAELGDNYWGRPRPNA